MKINLFFLTLKIFHLFLYSLKSDSVIYIFQFSSNLSNTGTMTSTQAIKFSVYMNFKRLMHNNCISLVLVSLFPKSLIGQRIVKILDKINDWLYCESIK